MSKMEELLEEIISDAVESYVFENLEDIFHDVWALMETNQKQIPEIISEVAKDWLECGDGYIEIQDEMERQAEQSCDYEYDCEKIIFEYGFTNSLEAAKEMGVRLSDTDESEVAAAVLKANLPSKKEVLSEVEEYLLGSDRLQYMLDEIREEQEAESKSENGGDA